MRRSFRSKELVRIYRDGNWILREGDLAKEMFIVQSGRVLVTKSAKEQEVPIAVIEPGGFFGEMSLLESIPRTASARALGDTRVLVILPGGLIPRIQRDPALAVEMLKSMSSRFRLFERKVVALIEGDGLSEEARRELVRLLDINEQAALSVDDP